jgi:GNAT superfamily N-acetyltransferase
MPISIQTVSGKQVLPWLDAVAALRIDVFRHFPYLYDGELEYERRYLTTYAQSTHSLFVLALNNDDQLVGASTGIPLTDAEPAFQAPFHAQNIPLENVFYFGESVLLPDYRGQGLGHRFFDEREKFARSIGKSITAFCAVERPDNHPLRPVDYTPLDIFWQARGYTKQQMMRALYSWLDIGEKTETDKPMVFWLKALEPKD